MLSQKPKALDFPVNDFPKKFLAGEDLNEIDRQPLDDHKYLLLLYHKYLLFSLSPSKKLKIDFFKDSNPVLVGYLTTVTTQFCLMQGAEAEAF